MLAYYLPATRDGMLGRAVEMPDLGTTRVAWSDTNLHGHVVGCVDQALDILRDREALPTGRNGRTGRPPRPAVPRRGHNSDDAQPTPRA